jgi:hypothetical protein
MVRLNAENCSILSPRLGKVASDWLKTQAFIETAELFIIRGIGRLRAFRGQTTPVTASDNDAN